VVWPAYVLHSATVAFILILLSELLSVVVFGVILLLTFVLTLGLIFSLGYLGKESLAKVDRSGSGNLEDESLRAQRSSPLRLVLAWILLLQGAENGH
jgi:hypothetical protein